MEDVIADALKDYDELDHDNIEKALLELVLRGVQVERCEDPSALRFIRSGRVTDYYAHQFSRPNNGIRSFQSFHEHAMDYLGAFTVQYLDTAQSLKAVGAKSAGVPLPVILHTVSNAGLQKSDKYTFESPVSDEISIEEFANRHVPDRNAVIVLRGKSAWILNRIKRKLADEGYVSVKIEFTRAKFSWCMWTVYQLGLLTKATFTHNRVANFLWGILGLFAGFLISQYTT